MKTSAAVVEVALDLIFYFLWYIIFCDGQINDAKCNSPQYFELGKSGTINCVFDVEFFAVLWYNSTDFENATPILTYKSHAKTGIGYDSGEFDVHPNGSLILNEVLLRQETLFTVAYVRSNKDDYITISVRVIVVVKPDVPFPVLLPCGNATNICYAEVHSNVMVCLVHNVRPNVSLEILARTAEGDKRIPTGSNIIPAAQGYTTRTTARNVFHFSPLLVFLVCKASGIPGQLEKDESFILALNGTVDLFNTRKQLTFVKQSTRMRLNCTDNASNFVVWKKIGLSSYIKDEVLLYSVSFEEKFTETFTDDYILGENDSLVVDSTQFAHDGIYACFFGAGVGDGLKIHNVTVVASEIPGMLEKNESLILALNGTVDIYNSRKHLKFVKRSTRMQLNCTDNANDVVVWKKIGSSSYREDEVLLYSVSIEEGYTETFSDDYFLGENDSLVVDSTQLAHDGIYACFFGNGKNNGVTIYNVTVVVMPDPLYPVIDGCNYQHEYCVMEVEYAGTLTCKIERVHPRAQLQWKTVYDNEEHLVSFTNQHLTVTNNGEIFDVILISNYRVNNRSLISALAIECKVVASNEYLHGLKAEMYLTFSKDVHLTQMCQLPTTLTATSQMIICYLVLPLQLLVLCGVVLIVFQNAQRRKAELLSLQLNKSTREEENNFTSSFQETNQNLYDTNSRT